MTLPFKPFLIALYFLSVGSFAQSKKSKVRITNPGKTIEIVGELGVKFGELVTVEGFVVEGPGGYENGLNLIVQKIGDSVIQNLIRIPLTPFQLVRMRKDFSKENKLNIEVGESYRLRVYETGKYVDIPLAASKEADNLFFLKRSNFYFRNELIVISGSKLKPITYHPADFINRKGLLVGKAKKRGNKSFIFGKDWKIELPPEFKWDSKDVNKKVEIHGIFKSTDKEGIFQIKEGKPRLIRLKDQLGRVVKLRGKARSLNGYWWFNYRGTNLYVEDMKNLPNWSVDNHGRTMEISGILMQEKKPEIIQTALNHHPYLKTYFIVKNATWKPIDGLLVPEIMEKLKRNSWYW